MHSFTIAFVGLSVFLLGTVISDQSAPPTTPFTQACTSMFLPVADDEITKNLTTSNLPGPFAFCVNAKTPYNATYCKLESCTGGPAAQTCKNITSPPEAKQLTTSGQPSNQVCELGYYIPPTQEKDATDTIHQPMCLVKTGDTYACDSINTNEGAIGCKECLYLPKSDQKDQTSKSPPATTSPAKPATTPATKTSPPTHVGGEP